MTQHRGGADGVHAGNLSTQPFPRVVSKELGAPLGGRAYAGAEADIKPSLLGLVAASLA